MDFAIRRTSTDEKPCEEAVLKNGTNNEFHIEINSIDELIGLIQKLNEDVIITTFGMIEIYDDYRE